MQYVFWLDWFPLWGVLAFTFAVIMISVKIGIILGHRRLKHPDHEASAPLGTIVGAALGLLSFLLTFTFGSAISRMQSRQQFLCEEVNAIYAAYLNASLLSQPYQSELHKLLLDYVDMRVKVINEDKLQKISEYVTQSEDVQDQMWQLAAALTKIESNSLINASFIDSLNKMIELQNKRVIVLSYRTPPTIWNVMYMIIIPVMILVGYQVGLSGKSCLRVSLVMALVFAMVTLLIAELDRAVEGNLRVNQQPMMELQKKLHDSHQEAIYIMPVSQKLNETYSG